MEYHEKALANMCRICGQRALKSRDIEKKKKPKKTCDYIELIKLLFGVDITTDNEDIHPQLLCVSCCQKLVDCRKPNRVKSIELYERDRKSVLSWETHQEENCIVCDRYKIQSQPGQWGHHKKVVKRSAITNMYTEPTTSTPKAPKRTVSDESEGSFVSWNRSLSSPLSKAEERSHTSLAKRKLHLSADKKSCLLKTGGPVSI